MLNWAARYLPILRVLKRELDESDSILEIGSGPFGIGRFYHVPFVGCDVGFSAKPRAPMSPVMASATELPFKDRSFEAVVVSDVLEHVPPDRRMAVVREAMRVTHKLAIFGFPSGSQAFDCDRKLAETYDRRQKVKPEWLREHMLHQFPTETLFEGLKRDWVITSFGNENVHFHHWIMRKEMYRVWDCCFKILLATLPSIVEFILKRTDQEPYYRRIVVIRRNPNPDLVAAEL